jgi:hypothetical protein
VLARLPSSASMKSAERVVGNAAGEYPDQGVGSEMSRNLRRPGGATKGAAAPRPEATPSRFEVWRRRIWFHFESLWQKSDQGERLR